MQVCVILVPGECEDSAQSPEDIADRLLEMLHTNRIPSFSLGVTCMGGHAGPMAGACSGLPFVVGVMGAVGLYCHASVVLGATVVVVDGARCGGSGTELPPGALQSSSELGPFLI